MLSGVASAFGRAFPGDVRRHSELLVWEGIMQEQDTKLIAHLLRRAGFGATQDELAAYAAQGYDATVEELLEPTDPRWMGDYVARRFHHEQSGMMGPWGSGDNWLYRMITTSAPLHEKITLLWHGIFATGYPKVIHGKMLSNQIRMFRRYGLGSFKTLLSELARDPARSVLPTPGRSLRSTCPPARRLTTLSRITSSRATTALDTCRTRVSALFDSVSKSPTDVLAISIGNLSVSLSPTFYVKLNRNETGCYT